MKEYKNIKVGYIPDCEIEYNKKKYLIHDVIDNEDILVDTSKNYPVLAKVTKPSEFRINDGCPFQKECGGCQFMHISYEYELKLKKDFINDLFKPFHLKKEIEIVPMFDPYHYRNKCQMTYKLSKSKKVVCGLYEEYSHRIVTISDCMLQATHANEVIKALNQILTKNKITPYDEKTRTGVLRHVYIRYGFNSKETMLVLVTNGEIFPGRGNVVKDINKANFGMGDREKVLMGPGYIYEMVGDFKFKISSRSFFQVNTVGMKKLYDLALSKSGITKNDIVIDAYCGVGTISIFASKYAKEVIGVELNKDAIKDANINAKLNKITNIEFIADDATNFMTHLAQARTKIDVVIMDPPRDGSTKQFINAIGYLKPRSVIYISCDPRSLKRDLYTFFDNDYSIKSIDAVDMFARTMHMETVCLLTCNEKK